MHLIALLSLHCLVVLFLELLSVISFGPFFSFLSWHVCYFKGWSLRCSPGRGSWSLSCDAVCGGGAEREQWRLLPSPPDFSLSSATHNQTGPLWCWFPSGWACARPRPLWVSPMNCPARLGVSPMLPQPPQMFSISDLRLYFPALEP